MSYRMQIYLFATALLCSGMINVNAQNKKVSINADNKPLTIVLQEIQAKTGYNILYSNEIVEDTMMVSLSATKVPTFEILQTILQPKNLFYFSRPNDMIIIGSNLLRGQGIAQAFSAATIKGQVIDENQLPLPFSTISLQKGNISLIDMAADENGKFILSLPLQKDSLYELVVTAVGFLLKSQKFKLEDISKIGRIQLIKEKNTLHNVIITGSKSPVERKADRFIYTPSAKISEGITAIELMRHVPLVQYEEKSNTFSLIGKTGTIVYINNRKSEIPSQMLIEMLRAMPANNIKSIELITNPGSEYAASLTGGIININLKRQLHEGWLGTLSFFTVAGPYNTTILNSLFNYRKGKLGIQFRPSILTDYNYYSNENKILYKDSTTNVINSNHYRRYSVFGNGLKIDYDIDQKNFLSYNGWFSLVNGKSKTATNTSYGKLTQAQPDSINTLPAKGNDFFIYNFGNINYHNNIDSTGQTYLDANIDYNHFFQKRKNYWEYNEKEKFSSYLPQKFLNLSAKLEYGKSFARNINFITGIQISSTKTDNDQHYFNFSNGSYLHDTNLSNHYTYNEKYYAGFISLSKQIGTKWNTKIGLRGESTNFETRELNFDRKADSNYLSLFPNGSISYAANKNNQFSLSYSRKIKRPNIELLFPGRTYISENYFSQNNPFLLPVFINSFDFSYTLKSKYVLSASYYNTENNFANFILPIVEDNKTYLKRSFYNYGYSRNLIIMLYMKHSLIKDFWDIIFSPTYVFNKYYSKMPEIPITITNSNYKIYFDNYFYLSKKRKWTGFVTLNYNSPVSDISGKRLNTISTLDLQIKKVIKKFTFDLILSDIYNGSSFIKTELSPNSLLVKNIQDANVYERRATFKVVYSFGNSKVRTTKNRQAANEDIRNRVN